MIITPTDRRIVTLSLNPAVDQTVWVPEFTVGRVNLVERQQSNAGGKGINVASFLADFGQKVIVTGLLGTANSEPFDELFRRKQIEDRFVRLPGRNRVNIKIVDKAQDKVTDINFPGLSTSHYDLLRLNETISDLCRNTHQQDDQHNAWNTDWFILSGSVPSSVPNRIYADLIRQLKEHGKKVVLDTSGVPFSEAISAGPNIVKPNIHELSELVGRPLNDQTDIKAAARSLVAAGVELVVVSMGADGALFMEGDTTVVAVPPRINAKSTVGAGDAMVAGIVTGTVCGLDLAARARLASAFSLSALGQVGPDLPNRESVQSCGAQVQISALRNR